MDHRTNERSPRSQSPGRFILMMLALAVVGASCPSTQGGQITRFEVIQRAQFWVFWQPKYDPDGSAPDPNGKYYRTDCSGFVSMALHLNGWPDTAQLGTSEYTFPISQAELKPGDILNVPLSGPAGHVRLFASWVPDSNMTQYNYYDFGSDPPKYGTSTYPGQKNGYDYQPRRYKNIVDDLPPGPPQGSFRGIVAGDFNKDGRSDLIGRTSEGDLLFYPGVAGGFQAWGTEVGQGWNIFTTIVAGDFNKDGRSDLIGRTSEGDLFFYPGVAGGFQAWGTKVGQGWNIFQ